MPKRLWPGLAMLALGASLVATAEPMPSSGAKQRGVFRVALAGASVAIDPQVSYVTTGWWLEYATAAKLLNYPDKRGQAGGLVRLGNARLRAFGRLDLAMMRNSAPVAPMRTYNNRFLFSDRVDPQSLVFQPVYADWSIPALALK
jgi:hypothetical protein